MIEQATINRIIDTANIVEVVGDFVTLRRRGSNYMACCPFHEEKTPSFSVSPSKGIFKCFGCSKAGNSVTFIMEHEHLNYVDALRYLAKKYGIEVEEKEETAEDIIRKNDRESMMIVSAFAQQFFVEQMKTKEGEAIGLSYFEERGFSRTTIKKFELGYAPENRSALVDAARNAGYKDEYLLKAGLCFQRHEDGVLMDRFAGRVIFPIHSLSGRVIAFGGRTLRTDKKVAKYVNSPESEIYLKRNNLYGIFFAKQSISRLDKCYLVEGYTDVISMFQSGIENVVASSGTSLTTEQIKLIARFTKNVTVLFDGDAAGIKASLRGIDMLLEEGMNIKVTLLPDGDDPDSFAKKHKADELISILNSNEQDFITFKANLLLGDVANDPLKKSEVILDIVRSIAIIPEMITRTLYVKECSTIMDIEEEVLRIQIAKLRKERLTAKKTKSEDTSQNEVVNLPQETKVIPAFVSNLYCEEQEKELLVFILKNGRDPLFKVENSEGETVIIHVDEYIISDLKNDELEFENLHYRQIFEEYDRILKENNTEPHKYFFNHENPKISNLTINLMSDEHTLSKIWDNTRNLFSLQNAVPKALAVYKSKIINMAISSLNEELKDATNPEEQNSLIEKIVFLHEQRVFFSSLLQRVIH